jgi:LPXTG-motif cell wall-anchored protein
MKKILVSLIIALVVLFIFAGMVHAETQDLDKLDKFGGRFIFKEEIITPAQNEVIEWVVKSGYKFTNNTIGAKYIVTITTNELEYSIKVTHLDGIRVYFEKVGVLEKREGLQTIKAEWKIVQDKKTMDINFDVSKKIIQEAVEEVRTTFIIGYEYPDKAHVMFKPSLGINDIYKLNKMKPFMINTSKVWKYNNCKPIWLYTKKDWSTEITTTTPTTTTPTTTTPTTTTPTTTTPTTTTLDTEELPKTGEASPILYIIIGVALLMVGGSAYYLFRTNH